MTSGRSTRCVITSPKPSVYRILLASPGVVLPAPGDMIKKEFFCIVVISNGNNRFFIGSHSLKNNTNPPWCLFQGFFYESLWVLPMILLHLKNTLKTMSDKLNTCEDRAKPCISLDTSDLGTSLTNSHAESQDEVSHWFSDKRRTSTQFL
jgi:hypothetical protein